MADGRYKLLGWTPRSPQAPEGYELWRMPDVDMHGPYTDPAGSLVKGHETGLSYNGSEKRVGSERVRCEKRVGGAKRQKGQREIQEPAGGVSVPRLS